MTCRSTEDDDGARAGEAAAPPAPRVYTVSELTSEIRLLLETRWADVWVEGEISNCRLWTTGHIYFSLKDAGAQLRAVMFKASARSLKFKLEDGQHVLARGRLGVYEPKGEYQIVCADIEPRGLGARQLALDQLKKRLQAEGLLDAARKRPLPSLPRKIGIVTSIDGAAIRDILKVLGRRYQNAQVIIAPARVQGDTAAADIARALGDIGRVEGVDVVIVGRGGGSIEDLWAFNEEPVARAIAACPVPVISAVGHEVDVTLADLVADLRAPTPSAAAEIVVAAKDEFTARIDRLADRASAAAHRRVQHRAAGAAAARSQAGDGGIRRPPRAARTARGGAAARSAARRDATAWRAGSARSRRSGSGSRRSICGAASDGSRRGSRRPTRGSRPPPSGSTTARRRGSCSLAARLDTLSPLAVLGRGYAVCWDDERRRILLEAASVSDGDAVRVTLHRGELRCIVTGREEER